MNTITMNISQHIAKHLREVYFGGNWTTSCLKDQLNGLTWQQATRQVHAFNSIATLTYHTTYYVSALIDVLQGKPLTAKDEYSFNLPPIRSQQDWDQLLERVWNEAEQASQLIEQLSDAILIRSFQEDKYGSYLRNLFGIIEHMHYHLGQIVLIRKMIEMQDVSTDQNS